MTAGKHLVVTCDRPGCKSYHQSHPNGGDLAVELRRWGWRTVHSGAEPKHFCPAHAKDFADPIPAPHDKDLVPPKFPPPSDKCRLPDHEPEDD